MRTKPTKEVKPPKILSQKFCFAQYGVKSFGDLIQSGEITHAGVQRVDSRRRRRMPMASADGIHRGMDYLQRVKVPVYLLFTTRNSYIRVPKEVYNYFVKSKKHQLI